MLSGRRLIDVCGALALACAAVRSRRFFANSRRVNPESHAGQLPWLSPSNVGSEQHEARLRRWRRRAASRQAGSRAEDEERTSTCALGEICSERCRFPSIEIVAHGAKFLAGQIKSRFAEQ